MNESNQNPSQDPEILERIKKFNEELLELLGKYKLALSAEPFIRANRIFARPALLDNSKPRPSTEQLKEKSEEPEPPGSKVEGELAEA